jgi:hypothetical protein
MKCEICEAAVDGLEALIDHLKAKHSNRPEVLAKFTPQKIGTTTQPKPRKI